jgi:hypothetical protein
VFIHNARIKTLEGQSGTAASSPRIFVYSSVSVIPPVLHNRIRSSTINSVRYQCFTALLNITVQKQIKHEQTVRALDDFHICVIARNVVELYALEVELPVVQLLKNPKEV